MANISTSPFALPPTVWIALLLSLAGAFALHQRSFQDSRPADPSTPLYRHLPSNDQDVEARLWQDPLAAVAAARLEDDKPAAAACTRHCKSAMSEHTVAGLRGKLLQHVAGGKSVLVLAALLTGAPYAEDAETRRRSRFSVLAGLYRAGYVPVNSQHLGYVTLSEFYQQDPDSQDLAAYEWFEAEHPSGASAAQILVVWLDQDGFRDTPLDRISRIVNSLTSTDACSPASTASVATVVLGPSDSDGLRAMSDELQHPKSGPCSNNQPTLRPLSIYSPRATASAANVLGDPSPQQPDLETLFHSWSDRVHLYRTVSTDDAVVRQLLTELAYRGISDLGQIALVVERDTLYARQMGEYFGGCRSSKDSGSVQPTCFTYLRGLDGLAPPAAAATATPTPGLAGALGATPSANQPTVSDDATGQGQLDYLSRLAKSMAGGKQSFRAIGVLGDDVYDKLMVLQALRSAYPRATFFTTDLDARLLDAGNVGWTRQLLIASSLGVALRPCLQQGIPPFRDTYQSTTFFSTVLAVSRFLADPICSSAAKGGKPSEDPAAGLQWTGNPRLFEIGRSQAFDLTREVPQPDCNLDGLCASIAAPQSLGVLGNPDRLYGFVWGVMMAVIALIMAWSGNGTQWIVSLIAARRRDGIRGSAQARRAIAGGLLLVLIIVCTFAWPMLVNEFTDNLKRAPASVLGGASLWAACLVELMSALAVLTLVVRGQRKLDENAEELHRRFGFGGTPRELARSHAQHFTTPMSRLKEMLQLPFGSGSKAALPTVDDRSQVEIVIARYLYRGTAAARVLRVSLATVLCTCALVGLELLLEHSLIGVAALIGLGPASGGSAELIAGMISLISLVFMLFLILWVADALLLSRSFLLELLDDNPQWPAEATKRIWQDLRLPSDQAVLWLDLQLIAMRTDWVTDLIWYPSLVILFMILAALTVEFGQFGFANNPAAIIVSTVLVAASALLLRNAAETWRGFVSGKLEDARLRNLSAWGGSRAEVRQLKNLLQRVEDLAEGAFAPLTAQPFVRAVLIPLVTYGASAVLSYFHISQ